LKRGKVFLGAVGKREDHKTKGLERGELNSIITKSLIEEMKL